jgi:ABC-type nickel/cobalt efflux system permease component RcnA
VRTQDWLGIEGEVNSGASAEDLIEHPTASYVLVTLVGFLLLFRSNLAYQRFWEARTHIQTIGAMWAEAASLAVAFDSSADTKFSRPSDYDEWKTDFIHLLSLQHALAVMSLRTDRDLGNIVEHRPFQRFDGALPPIAATPGNNERDEHAHPHHGPQAAVQHARSDDGSEAIASPRDWSRMHSAPALDVRHSPAVVRHGRVETPAVAAGTGTHAATSRMVMCHATPRHAVPYDTVTTVIS